MSRATRQSSRDVECCLLCQVNHLTWHATVPHPQLFQGHSESQLPVGTSVLDATRCCYSQQTASNSHNAAAAAFSPLRRERFHVTLTVQVTVAKNIRLTLLENTVPHYKPATKRCSLKHSAAKGATKLACKVQCSMCLLALTQAAARQNQRLPPTVLQIYSCAPLCCIVTPR